MRRSGFSTWTAALVFTAGLAVNTFGIPHTLTIGYPREGATWEKGLSYHVDITTYGCAAPGHQLEIVLFPDMPNKSSHHAAVETSDSGYPVPMGSSSPRPDGVNASTLYTIHDRSDFLADGSFSIGVTIPADMYSGYYCLGVGIWNSSNSTYLLTAVTGPNIQIIDPLPSHILVTNPSTWDIKWAQGSTQTITWTTSGDPIARVKIELQRGAGYQLLSADAPNTGTFVWTIPADQEIRSDYLVGITAVNDERIRDYSDSQFAVVPPGEASVITVDGYPDAFYTTLTGPENGFLQIPSCAYNDIGRPADNSDLSVKIWTAWDSDWLYVYEEVTDDTVSGSSGNRWEEDCLELYVDPSPTDPSINSIWNARLTALNILTPGVLADDNMNTVADESKLFSRRLIPGGYALELKVRWAAVTSQSETVNPAAGNVIGFAIMQHDNDGRGKRQASVEWAAVMLNAVYNTPAYMGKVTLLPENRLKFEAKNNITGTENPIPYTGSSCTDLLCEIDGYKDWYYFGLTGPADGYLHLRSYAHNENGAPASDADLSARIWTAWDDQWFYLYEEVQDDTLGADATNLWEEDEIELKFDPVPTAPANSIWDTRLTALDRTTPGVIADDNLNNVVADSKVATRRTIPGGYALEMAVRWTAIVNGSETITPSVGSVFGLAINQHDNDLRGRRHATVQWAAVLSDAAWNTPTYLGTVRFLEGNKLEFSARNNITGTTNPVPYDGSDYDPSGAGGAREIPAAFGLIQNYPNPFNPSTGIRYSVSVHGRLRLAVYNSLGQSVRVLREGRCAPGSYETVWDGQDDLGIEVGSGIYVVVLSGDGRTVARKMVKVE